MDKRGWRLAIMRYVSGRAETCERSLTRSTRPTASASPRSPFSTEGVQVFDEACDGSSGAFVCRTGILLDRVFQGWPG